MYLLFNVVISKEESNQFIQPAIKYHGINPQARAQAQELTAAHNAQYDATTQAAAATEKVPGVMLINNDDD